MDAWLRRWEDACASSPFLRFLDINLRGIGQVMFQDNPLTGLLFLVAVASGSFSAGAPYIVFGGVLGLVAATLAGFWLRVDDATLRAGLCGYNGVLVGLALPTFLAPGPLLWIYVLLGGAVSTIVNLGAANALKPFGAPTLTFPFVIVTWILLLATHGFAGLSGAVPPSAAEVQPLEAAPGVAAGLGAFVEGVLLSISQVFLKASGFSAVLLLAGLAVNSVAAAAFALGGAILAVLVAHAFGAESEIIAGGLLGFSPVLTAIALGVTFHRPNPRVAAYAALGVVFTVIAQVALGVALKPFAIPALTAPFVLVSWMFLLPQRRFDEEEA
jgi:urea transporter